MSVSGGRSARALAAFYATLFAVLMSASGLAWATADGPDHYVVRGVKPGDAAAMRAQPRPDGRLILWVPADAQCLRNLGCRGGATREQLQTPATADKVRPRWCRVEYQSTIGWIEGRYLAEGACPASGAR